MAYLISASPLAGPKDLVPATLAQFVVRTSMGAGRRVGAATTVPGPPDDRHPWLGNRVMVTLGRWSYGLFVWHLAALVMVVPRWLGTFMFNSDLIIVFILTTLLGMRWPR